MSQTANGKANILNGISRVTTNENIKITSYYNWNYPITNSMLRISTKMCEYHPKKL